VKTLIFPHRIGHVRGERKDRESGFSLLELMVVMAILALGLSVIPLAFGGRSEAAAVSNTAREISSALRNTRSAALAHSRNQDFVFDLGGRVFQTEGGVSRTIPVGASIAVEVPQSMMSGDFAIVRFFPDGSSTGALITADVETNELSTGPSLAETIRVDWLSGRVSRDRSGQSAQ